MDFSRCDDCCDVLGGIDDGVVYDCDTEVEEKYGYVHLCVDCIDSNDELYLFEDCPIYIVKIDI
jgi:hypothetical protein